MNEIEIEMELREEANICFEKNGLLWVHIDSEDTFSRWVSLCGFKTVSGFLLITESEKTDFIGKTVSIKDGIVLYAEEQDWWDTLDIERLKAVMNERIFGWALSGAFLAFMGELEFAENVMEQFAKVSGDSIQEALSSTFMNDVWFPASDTTDFLEDVSWFLLGEFSIKYALGGVKIDGIQYFI